MTKQQLSEFISSPTFKDHFKDFDNFTDFDCDELAELAYDVTPFISGDEDKQLPIEAKRMFVEDKLDEDDVLRTYHEFCVENKWEAWEDNDGMFFETAFGDDAYEAVKAVCLGDYRLSDELVRFDGYANLESAEKSEVYDEAMGEDSFIAYAFDNSDDDDLQSISEAEIEILDFAKWLIGMGYRKTEGED